VASNLANPIKEKSMQTYEENSEFIDGMIYLKMENGVVNAYGDMESLINAEQKSQTGKLFDASCTPHEWVDIADCEAKIIDGKIVLGLSEEDKRKANEEIIRTERQNRLRQCDKISPMRWMDMTEDEKKKWLEYRQALLDITEQEGFPWDGDINAVPWPEKVF
jgi:hypothetical protein